MAAVGGGEGDDGDGGGGKAGCLGGGVGGGADALSVVWVPLKAQPGAGLAAGSAGRGDGDGVSGDGDGDGFCQESGAQIHGVGGRQMFCWKMVSQTQLQLALQHVPWLKLLEMQILHKLDWQAGGGTAAAAGDATVRYTGGGTAAAAGDATVRYILVIDAISLFVQGFGARGRTVLIPFLCMLLAKRRTKS